jgi:hypothetical protein
MLKKIIKGNYQFPNSEREKQLVSFMSPPKNVTATLPFEMVQIERISCVQFVIEGTLGKLPPSSLAVTAYINNNGTALKVLSAVNSQSTVFRVTLEKGAYILLAAATWLPGRKRVDGYVIYKFIVKVV